MNTTGITEGLALKKAQQYCAYQERCTAEVREKLLSLGLKENQIHDVISKLIEEKYLDEGRFATQFAGGKFRMKQWGKTKISYALKKKQVHGQYIQTALKQISEQSYQQTLKRLAERKIKTLSGEKNSYTRKRKLLDYLLQKGYERALIMQIAEAQLKSAAQ